MAKAPGSIWVDGETFRFIDATGNEYYYTGTAGSSPAGAKAGSIWVDGNDFHYISATGVDRTIAYTDLGVAAGSKQVQYGCKPHSGNGYHRQETLVVVTPT
jgi:hypothetical protein